MRIAIASDHAGFHYKGRIITLLRQLGHDVRRLRHFEHHLKGVAASLLREDPRIGRQGKIRKGLAELINQRRRELFLESHHLGDVIRYAIPVAPVAGTAYHFGGTYGNQLCFPMPAAERLNNPLIGS